MAILLTKFRPYHDNHHRANQYSQKKTQSTSLRKTHNGILCTRHAMSISKILHQGGYRGYARYLDITRQTHERVNEIARSRSD